MLHSAFASLGRVIVLLAIGLGSLPAVANAETAATMRVERTPMYEVVLSIGPAADLTPSMAMSPAQSTDMTMGHDTGMMVPHQADQGMAVNHWLDVHITQADSGLVVVDLTRTIRITDKSSGEARDLPGIMGISGGMSSSDFHYGQNVFLPDGTYEVTVQLGPGDTAIFRDVMVVASPMMEEPSMTPAMGGSHDMSMSTQNQPAAHP